MPETVPRYRAILTSAAFELEANALASGEGIVLTHIACGDANGAYVEPETDATGLVHEVWRAKIDNREVDPQDPNITNVMATIPASVGGFWIREVGVFGHLESAPEKEILYVYANHAPYYKLLPVDGQSVTHELIIPVVQTGNAEVTIQVSDLGYVTKSRFKAENIQHKCWLAEMYGQVITFMDERTKMALCRIEQENGRDLALGREAQTQASLIGIMDRLTRLEAAYCGQTKLF